MGGLGSVPLPPCHQHGDLVLADTQTEREARCSAAWASHNPSNQWCSANFVIFWPLGAESFMGARGGPRPFLPPPPPRPPPPGLLPAARLHVRAGASASRCGRRRPSSAPAVSVVKRRRVCRIAFGHPSVGGEGDAFVSPSFILAVHNRWMCMCTYIYVCIHTIYIYYIYIMYITVIISG